MGANRRLANAKSSMLQENKRDAAYMCVRTSFDTHSDRHVLGCLLLCAAVIALLCCAVLCCAHGSTTTYILVHTTAVLLLLYPCTAIPPVTLAHKEAWIGMTDICSKYKGASRRAALAARRFARRLHAMSSAVVVFAFLPAGCLMSFLPAR